MPFNRSDAAVRDLLRHVAVVTFAATACADGRGTPAAVADVVAVAPAQSVGGMSITPSLDTVHNAPEQGMIALSMDLQIRPTGGPVHLPQVGFRAWREGSRITQAAWEFPPTDIGRRRGSDTLGTCETTSYGLTTAPGMLLQSDSTPGDFRIEAFLRDRTGGEHRVQVGRVRVRRQE
jgi:hypothetical protein